MFWIRACRSYGHGRFLGRVHAINARRAKPAATERAGHRAADAADASVTETIIHRETGENFVDALNPALMITPCLYSFSAFPSTPTRRTCAAPPRLRPRS